MQYQKIDKKDPFYKKLRTIGLRIIAVLIALTAVFSWKFGPIGLLALGTLVIYLSLITKYVSPPNNYVVEINFPGKETMALAWKPGINFLWIPIVMKVANQVYCGDDVRTLQIGLDEGDGTEGKVEFLDAAAAVIVQMTLRVSDPIKAAYETTDYRKASIGIAEAEIRKQFGGQNLDEAMSETFKSAKSKEIFKHTNKAIATWGVSLVSPIKEISIIDFRLDETTDKTRKMVLDAEKEAAAVEIKAEGLKKAKIKEKEAEAEGINLITDAETRRIRNINTSEGKGEAEKIQILARYLKLPYEKVIDYLLKQGMLKAVDGSTIIATSEGGMLNTPIGLAQTLFAVDSAQKKQGDKK